MPQLSHNHWLFCFFFFFFFMLYFTLEFHYQVSLGTLKSFFLFKKMFVPFVY